MNRNYSLIFGSLFGFFAVLFGAFGAHYLSKDFTSDQLSIFETAVRYQMYHAIILCLNGLLVTKSTSKYLRFSSYLFITGIFVFSGSLYLYVLSSIILFALVTPIGGVALIAGWGLLFYSAITNEINFSSN